MERDKTYKEIARQIDNDRILASLDFLIQLGGQFGAEDNMGNLIGERELSFLEGNSHLLTSQELRTIADIVPQGYLKAAFEDLYERVERTVDSRILQNPALYSNEEKIAIYNYLLSEDWACELSGNEFQKDETPLTEKVAQFYLAKYDGYIEREGIGIVELSKEGVKASLAHGIGHTKSAAFAAVPDIIKDGKIIDHQTNWKGRGKDTYSIAAPVKIGSSGYTGVVVVTQSKVKNKFYLHEVILQKNLRIGFKTETESRSPIGDITKVIQNLQNPTVLAKNNNHKKEKIMETSYPEAIFSKEDLLQMARELQVEGTFDADKFGSGFVDELTHYWQHQDEFLKDLEQYSEAHNVVESVKNEKSPIELVVVNENILGYIPPKMPKHVFFLHASRLKGANIGIGQSEMMLGSSDKVRLASKEDFDAFNVDFSGYENDTLSNYKYAGKEVKIANNHPQKGKVYALMTEFVDEPKKYKVVDISPNGNMIRVRDYKTFFEKSLWLEEFNTQQERAKKFNESIINSKNNNKMENMEQQNNNPAAVPEGLQPEPEMTSPGKKIKGEEGGVELQKASNIAEGVMGNLAHNFNKNAKATSDKEGKPYEGINPEAVHWEELEKWGISKADLEKNGDLKKMLLGAGKKSGLVNISFVSKENGVKVHDSTPARLSFKKNDDETWSFRYNLRKPKESLNNLEGYYGYKFSGEDRSNLAVTGNLGKVIMVNLPSLNPNEKTPVLLSLDRLTNELIARNVNDTKLLNGLTVPQKLHGVELTPEQQADLKNGKAVKVDGMVKKDGSTYDAVMQYNTVERKFDFVRNEIANGLKKDLTVDQQVDLIINRKVVHIENGTDKKGKPYTAWIAYNPGKVDKNGKATNVSFYKSDPTQKKVVAPTQESSVQAQVNNEGHKPEALKNVPGAAEQGQGASKTPQQAAKVNEQKKQYAPANKPATPKKSSGPKL